MLLITAVNFCDMGERISGFMIYVNPARLFIYGCTIIQPAVFEMLLLLTTLSAIHPAAGFGCINDLNENLHSPLLSNQGS